MVFKSQKREAITDLLHAWTTNGTPFEHPDDMVGVYAGHLIDLHNLGPFSPRLRRLVIRFVEILGCEGFEGAGLGRLIELLDQLHVAVEDMDEWNSWMSLLLDVIRAPGGTQHLSRLYWELLVEVAVLVPWYLEFEDNDALYVAKILIDAQEWDKLECWIGIVWIYCVTVSGGITAEELEDPTLLLLHQRPGAAQRLEQWMERWNQRHKWPVPESFRRFLTRAHEAVQPRDAP